MRRLIFTIVLIAVAWSLASAGYFELRPVLGAAVGYNDAPLTYALYYLAWALMVMAVFRRALAVRWPSSDEAMLGAMMIVGFAAFAILVLPRLPETEWTRSQTPVEFFWANSWYFLPKSAEILFQQVLIAALILALDALGLPLKRISLLVAALFGGFHLTLALMYPNPLYVVRYTFAATLFGAIVPWFILRLRYGFFISYAVHWGYYALDAIAIHFVFAAD